jgi:hypothetical protein
MNMKNDATLARRNRPIIDGQIVVALAEAFLLGIVFRTRAVEAIDGCVARARVWRRRRANC